MKENRPPSDDESHTILEAFLTYQNFLKNFVRQFLTRAEDVEDVMQETFLKAYSSEKKQTINHPKAFLFRVARNTALKKLTKKSKQVMSYIDELEPNEVNLESCDVEDDAMAREKLGLFCQSALAMSPRCRRVFLLAKVYGFSYKEIAAQLGISVSAVEKHVAKGLLICSTYMATTENFDSPAASENQAASSVRQRGRNR